MADRIREREGPHLMAGRLGVPRSTIGSLCFLQVVAGRTLLVGGSSGKSEETLKRGYRVGKYSCRTGRLGGDARHKSRFDVVAG